MNKKQTVVTLMVLSLVGFVIGAGLTDVYGLLRLIRLGQPTTGIIVEKERENHQNITFEYKVGEQNYLSIAHAGDFARTFDSVQLGEVIQVVYDPSQPSRVVAGNPSSYLWSNVRLSLIFAFIPMLLFAVYVWKKKHLGRPATK